MAEVKTGIQDDDYIQIISGIKEGDEVVKGPYSAVSRKLKQGSAVVREKEKKDKDSEEK
jgi:HlyD family secretion protein